MESDVVKESLRNLILVDKCPVPTGIDGAVDAGLVAGAGGHDVDRLSVESLESAEIEIRWQSGHAGPMLARVNCSEYAPASAGGPDLAIADCSDRAERSF